MVKVNLTKVIHVSREKVIEYFTNPDLYFKVHSKYYKSFNIVSHEDNIVIVDEEWEFGGRRLNFTHKITFNLPYYINMDIIKGNGVGSSETIAFEEVSNGTKVTYTINFKLGGITGRILGWFAGKQIKRMIEEMVEEDCRYLEKK